jgi:hypothetical protein
MANTYALTINASLDNGSNDKVTFVPPRVSNTASAFNYHATMWAVGTSAESMPTGDVSNYRWLHLKNLDSTNYVTIGPDSGGSQIDMLKLLPGDVAVLPIKPGITIKGTANTAACKVSVLLTDSTT